MCVWDRETGRERRGSYNSTAPPINLLSLPPNLMVSVLHHGLLLFIRDCEYIIIVLVELAILWGTKIIFEGQLLIPFGRARHPSNVHSTLYLPQSFPSPELQTPSLLASPYTFSPMPFFPHSGNTHSIPLSSLRNPTQDARPSSHVTFRNNSLVTGTQRWSRWEQRRTIMSLGWKSPLSVRGTTVGLLPICPLWAMCMRVQTHAFQENSSPNRK